MDFEPICTYKNAMQLFKEVLDVEASTHILISFYTPSYMHTPAVMPCFARSFFLLVWMKIWTNNWPNSQG